MRIYDETSNAACSSQRQHVITVQGASIVAASCSPESSLRKTLVSFSPCTLSSNLTWSAHEATTWAQIFLLAWTRSRLVRVQGASLREKCFQTSRKHHERLAIWVPIIPYGYTSFIWFHFLFRAWTKTKNLIKLKQIALQIWAATVNFSFRLRINKEHIGEEEYKSVTQNKSMYISTVLANK
jgi:hypothetical protein